MGRFQAFFPTDAPVSTLNRRTPLVLNPENLSKTCRIKKYNVNTVCGWFPGAVGLMVENDDLVLTGKYSPVLSGLQLDVFYSMNPG
jgi:hypothetical protein